MGGEDPKGVKVSAIVVTRGDVDLRPVVKSLEKTAAIAEVVVWDNGGPSLKRCWRDDDGWMVQSGGGNLDVAVYGRYAAIVHASHEVIYVQDDDCVVDVARVIEAYEPGRLVANMPYSRWLDYPDSCLVGWGAVFDRELPSSAFDLFQQTVPVMGLSNYGWSMPGSERFNRECDIVFSALTPHTIIDVGFRHLPWAEQPGRMFTSGGEARENDRREMLELSRLVRGRSRADRKTRSVVT